MSITSCHELEKSSKSTIHLSSSEPKLIQNIWCTNTPYSATHLCDVNLSDVTCSFERYHRAWSIRIPTARVGQSFKHLSLDIVSSGGVS